MNNSKVMEKILLPLTLIALMLLGCKKIEYINNKPQLEIIVTDDKESHIQGADVLLYESEQDWINKTNQLNNKTTDLSGIALFTDLETKIYYFYVEKGELNNSESIAVIDKELKENTKAQVSTIIK